MSVCFILTRLLSLSGQLSKPGVNARQRKQNRELPKVLISEKVTEDEDEENPVKYLVTNKIDAPTKHLIRTYSMRWRIETFFRDSKQDLGFEDCEVERDAGASRHWHLTPCESR